MNYRKGIRYNKRCAIELANMVLISEKTYDIGYIIAFESLKTMEVHDEFYSE